MRFRLPLRALLALALLPACGKSTRGAPVDVGAVTAGAAGEAGQEMSGGAAQAGTTGEPPGVGSATGGASQGCAALVGGAGGEATSHCVDLLCLAGVDLVYQPTAVWQPRSLEGMPDSIELDSAEYVKKPNLASVSLHFSADGSELELTPVFSSQRTNGTRDPGHTDRTWYALESFAGGRFVIRATADGLRGEHTVYGSGNPIVESTVGYIE
jgi:hypothetical protein